MKVNEITEIKLLAVNGAKFVRLLSNDKVPFEDNWQENPVQLADIHHLNVGLMLGPHSDGICAIDFDGEWAWQFYADNFGSTLPDTVSWSSGKPFRAQFAFKVPAEYWPYLATKKVWGPRNTQYEKDLIEFRWSRSQSVLPPSMHPQTGKPYIWLNSPVDTSIATIPGDVLAYWLNVCNPAPVAKQTTTFTPLSGNAEEVLADIYMKVIRDNEPVQGYDDWRQLAHGLAHGLGIEVADQIMRKYYPEENDGEYKRLFRSYKKNSSPTMGSVVHRWKQYKAMTSESDMNQIRQILRENAVDDTFNPYSGHDNPLQRDLRNQRAAIRKALGGF